MNLKRSAALVALSMFVLALGTYPGAADDLPETKLHVIGSASFSNIWSALEKPFWTKTVPEASKGKVTADLTAHTESGLKGPEIIRLLGSGALDIAFGDFGSVAGDESSLEGLVLAGVIADFDTLHKAATAYKPVIDSVLKKHGIKLMGLFPFPEFAFFCRGSVTSLDDLAGLKVRVYTQSMTQVIEKLGAVPASLPFGDVIPALQTGVVDCAITGTFSGNKAGWSEVTDSLFTLPLGSGISFYGFNEAAWSKLDPAVRDFLEEQFDAFEKQAWEVTAQQSQDGINCNTGTGKCMNGKQTDMALHKPSQADYQRIRKIAQDIVLPSWAESCGPECARNWNETVGKVVGMKAGDKS